MSYILSALKKAEQSRDGRHPDAGAIGTGGGLNTGLSDGAARYRPAAPSGRPLWFWLGIVAVMGGIIAALLFTLDKGPAVPSPQRLHTQTLSPEIQSPDLVQAVQPQATVNSVEPAALAEANKFSEPQSLATVPASANDRQPGSRNIDRITNPGAGVSGNAAATLPTLNITGYIFFENNPAASKLFVDGIVYRLGSTLGDSMIIREFKPDSVIVSWRGTAHDVLIP